MIKLIINSISNFKKILNKNQKKRLIGLFVIMIIGGFLEMGSVTLIVPFIQTIMSPDEVMSNSLVIAVMDITGIQIYQTFLVFLSLVMALLFLIKNLFLIFQLTVQERFIRKSLLSTQNELLKNIIYKPYEYYLNVQSGEIMRIVMEDTNKAYSSLSVLLSFFSELIVSSILLITIFIISPVITVSIGILLLFATLIIYKVSQNRLRKNAIREMHAMTAMNQTVLQIVQGIKEIKLMRKEEYFREEYDKNGKIVIRSKYIGQLLGLLPRFMLEAAAMCSFFVILAGLIYKGVEVKILIPAVSGVAMAAVRFLPSINRISSALSTLTYYQPAVEKLLETMDSIDDGQQIKDATLEKISKQKVDRLRESIVMSGISYSYPCGETTILNDANMKIVKGQSIGIVGASGAGKTTAIDIMLGLLKPQAGKIMIDGTDIEQDRNGWFEQIGYIPQTIFMLDTSIRENVAFGMKVADIDDAMVWDALREAALDEFVRELPDGLDTQIGERGIRLSGGQRQRIGIARALYTKPDVLFLDEATSALDTETENAIMESIANLQGKTTLIIIAHRLTTIASCDVIYRVADGKIVRER